MSTVQPAQINPNVINPNQIFLPNSSILNSASGIFSRLPQSQVQVQNSRTGSTLLSLINTVFQGTQTAQTQQTQAQTNSTQATNSIWLNGTGSSVVSSSPTLLALTSGLSSGLVLFYQWNTLTPSQQAGAIISEISLIAGIAMNYYKNYKASDTQNAASQQNQSASQASKTAQTLQMLFVVLTSLPQFLTDTNKQSLISHYSQLETILSGASAEALPNNIALALGNIMGCINVDSAKDNTISSATQQQIQQVVNQTLIPYINLLISGTSANSATNQMSINVAPISTTTHTPTSITNVSPSKMEEGNG
jgi:hypothetical protein